MMACPHCGARYGDDARFCPLDGSALVGLNAAASSSASPRRGGPAIGEPSGASAPPEAAQRALERDGETVAASSSASWIAPPVPSPSGPSPQGSPAASSSASWIAGPAEGSQSGSAWHGGAAATSLSAATDDEESLVGQVLGDRYRVDERIGIGGMGVVYRATHVMIGKRMAIKVLRQRYARQAELAQRFAQEARVASGIKHPNVVDIVDYGETPGGSPYYVMEFLAGHSLAEEIRTGGGLAPRRALALAGQVARGLAAAHQSGVVHRDLKPDNVFICPASEDLPERAKILDFGIARVVHRQTRLTAEGSVVGTPEYMSPEQARGDEVDARSDLYALGVMVFEALTGQVPLTADSLVGTLTKQVFEVPPKIREVDPRLSGCPSIEAALARLLAKNRDERPSSALEAGRLLQTAAANDLEPASDDRRAQAVLEGWGAEASGREAAAPAERRSTIMIGSGSVTSAHQSAAADAPATGSFAAKATPQPALAKAGKRPSVIVEGTPARLRPARILQAPEVAAPAAPPTSAAPQATPRRGLGRHLPLIMLALGAAIFAALVTIGFVQWMERERDQNGARTDPDEARERG